MIRTKYEQETIINYNQEEPDASVYTFDQKLIRKIERLISEGREIKRIRQGEGWREYLLPKKWIKINASLVLTDEQREERRARGLENSQFLRKKGEEE